MAKLPLYEQPQGSAQLGPESNGSWHLTGETNGDVICQGCGTEHPAITGEDDFYGLSVIAGHLIVDQCCGVIIDRIYEATKTAKGYE